MEITKIRQIDSVFREFKIKCKGDYKNQADR